MRAVFNKLVSATVVFLILWIVACEIGNVQSTSCMAEVTCCRTAAEGMIGGIPCLFSCAPSNGSKAPQSNGYVSADTLIQDHSDVACCNITTCAGKGREEYVLPATPESHSLPGIMPSHENAALVVNISYLSKRIVRSFQTIPVYIQKCVLLC